MGLELNREPTSLHIQRTAVSLLMNYVRLVPGMPTRMHFTDYYYIDREVADKESGKIKKIKSLVFWVDELEGEDCARTFSILSQKLAAPLEEFLGGREFLKYDFIITQIGDGYYKDWNVQPILRPE